MVINNFGSGFNSKKSLAEILSEKNHSLQENMPKISQFARHYEIPSDGRTPESNKKLIHKAINNLYNPQIQKKVALISNEEVLAKVEQMGYRFITLNDKVEQVDFFGSESEFNYISPVNSNHSSSYLDTGRHTPSIPLETGDFANDHGAISHARQILAITYNMSKTEKEHFKGFVGSMFGSNITRWALWDIFFDAPGNALPNSPRFWRDLQEDRP